MRFFSEESGNVFVSVLMGSALLAALASQVSGVSIRGQAFQKRNSERINIDVIKSTVLQRLDCSKTLESRSAYESTPRCRDFRNGVLIRRSDGSVLNPNNQIGEWTLKASCPLINGKDADELVITLHKEGVDPITKTPWSKMKYAADLFEGVSDFCREQFSEQETEQEPDLACFWGYRDQTGIHTEGNGAYGKLLRPYNGGIDDEKWYGMQCASGYNRTGCSLRTKETKGDFDVRYIDRGCFTDDEEWESGAQLYINCCKLSQKRV